MSQLVDSDACLRPTTDRAPAGDLQRRDLRALEAQRLLRVLLRGDGELELEFLEGVLPVLGTVHGEHRPVRDVLDVVPRGDVIAHLGSGRTVTSEAEAPNMLVNLV